jgi:large subunit ribosomal protein L9
MKVFLVQDVKGLGRKGELKEVNDGYARNFLFAKGLAVIPTDSSTKKIQEEKILANQENKKHRSELENRIKELDGKEFVFKVKADKEGKLYGSLGPKDLAKIIGVDEKMIDVHFKKIGQYALVLKFGQDLLANLQIVVEKEK